METELGQGLRQLRPAIVSRRAGRGYLGYQGRELLETGRLTLLMPEPERSRVMAVRRGERSFGGVIAEITDVECRLDIALERTELPESPDDEAVNAFLVDAYRQARGW